MKYRIIYRATINGVYLLQEFREFLFFEWWNTISVSSDINYLKEVIDNLENLNNYIKNKNL